MTRASLARSHWLPFVAIGVSLVSLILLLFAPRSAGSPVDTVELHARALAERIDEIEFRLRLLVTRAPHDADPMRESAPAAADGPNASTALLEACLARLDRIETRMEELRRRGPRAWVSPEGLEALALLEHLDAAHDDYPHLDWLRRSDEALSPEDVARLLRIAEDATAGHAARLDALLALRDIGALLGRNLLDEAACSAALGLLGLGLDEDERRKVYDVLEGQTHPFLRAPLLEAARSEASARVRDDIVGTLSHFLPDRECEELLVYLRDNDPDPAVRDEAEEALRKIVR